MSKPTRVSIAAVFLVGVIAGLGGYLLGHSGAPNMDDARTEQREAFRVAFRSSFPNALDRGEVKGRKLGLKRGQRKGERQGTRRGNTVGSENVSEEQARLAAEAVTEEAAAQAEVLPPIPDGADEPNPAELCEAAPVSAAEFGYSCP